MVPEVGRLGSRLLWYNRSHAFEKIEALLADGSAPPLGERIDSLETVEYPAKASSEYSQLDMVHRLPKAKLVDRFEYLTQLCAGQRVVHVGFADIGCQSLNEEADAWLHTRLAASARELVGLDVDEQGVALARERGYEAHVVDCSDPDAVRALGLPPADVVVAGEVIEHIDDARAFLDALHVLVRPDGILVVTTPNATALVEHRRRASPTSRSTIPTTSRRSRRTRSTRCSAATTGSRSSTRCSCTRSRSGRDGTLRGRTLTLGGRVALQTESLLARLGRPYLARGLIVLTRSTLPDAPPA